MEEHLEDNPPCWEGQCPILGDEVSVYSQALCRRMAEVVSLAWSQEHLQATRCPLLVLEQNLPAFSARPESIELSSSVMAHIIQGAQS